MCLLSLCYSLYSRLYVCCTPVRGYSEWKQRKEKRESEWRFRLFVPLLTHCLILLREVLRVSFSFTSCILFQHRLLLLQLCVCVSLSLFFRSLDTNHNFFSFQTVCANVQHNNNKRNSSSNSSSQQKEAEGVIDRSQSLAVRHE